MNFFHWVFEMRFKSSSDILVLNLGHFQIFERVKECIRFDVWDKFFASLIETYDKIICINSFGSESMLKFFFFLFLKIIREKKIRGAQQEYESNIFVLIIEFRGFTVLSYQVIWTLWRFNSLERWDVKMSFWIDITLVLKENEKNIVQYFTSKQGLISKYNESVLGILSWVNDLLFLFLWNNGMEKRFRKNEAIDDDSTLVTSRQCLTMLSL